MIKIVLGTLVIILLYWLFKQLRVILKKEDRQKDLNEDREEAIDDLEDLQAESNTMDVKEEIQTLESELDQRIDKFNNKVK